MMTLSRNMYKTGIFLAAMLLVSMFLARVLWLNQHRIFMEAVFISCFTLIFVFIRDVRLYVNDLPSAMKWLLSAFLFLMFVAHVIGQDRTTLPFVSWHMYTTKANAEDSSYVELAGLTQNGSPIISDPSRLFNTKHGVGLMEKLREYQGLERSQAKENGTQRAQSKLKSPLKELALGIRWAFREKEVDLAVKKKQLD